MTTIVWFRNDLRLADNPALADGVRQGDIIPLFIWDDSSADIHYGSAAKWWLHYSLDALDQSLKERGSRLLIRRGKPADILPKVIAESDAHKVVWNRRYDPQGIATDTKLKAALVEMNIEVESFNGNLLMEPWELKTKTGGPYKVFSPFWKNLISHPRPLAPIAAPGKLSQMQLGTERLEDLELRPKLSWADGFGEYWTPGHHAAQEGSRRLRCIYCARLQRAQESPGEAWNLPSLASIALWRNKSAPSLAEYRITPSQCT